MAGLASASPREGGHMELEAWALPPSGACWLHKLLGSLGANFTFLVFVNHFPSGGVREKRTQLCQLDAPVPARVHRLRGARTPQRTPQGWLLPAWPLYPWVIATWSK